MFDFLKPEVIELATKNDIVILNQNMKLMTAEFIRLREAIEGKEDVQ